MTPAPGHVSSLTEIGENDVEGSASTKRRRVVSACNACRSAKIKCDASKPVCGPCNRRYGPHAACEWGIRRGRGTAKAKGADLQRLQRRIEELEREKQQPVSPDDPATDHLSPTLEMADSPDGVHDQYIESNAMMGFVENINDATSQHPNDSNATSFMNLIRSLVDHGRPFAESHASQVLANSPLSRLHGRKASLRRRLPAYVLPSRQQADHLLMVYHQLVATLYPFLDLDEVDILYQRLWTGEDLGDDGLTFLCLINVIFSLACNLDSTIIPQQRVYAAEVFFNRAKDLLQLDIVQQRSLITVQCFLLLGQYLQSTNDPQQCWIYVGFAIRIAQSLSLDVPVINTRDSLHDREMARKVWHGCVLMDQTLSMTFGRPAMIASHASASVPLPMAHLDSSMCTCFTHLLAESSTNECHFFVETLKLYNLMSETLTKLYSSETMETVSNDLNVVYFGTLGAAAVGSLLEINHKLSYWFKSLPMHLRQGHGSNNAIHNRQRNVLYIRHSHVSILLFRPVLARYCSRASSQESTLGPVEDSLTTNIALQFSIACVKAALQTIEYFDAAMSDREIGNLDDLLPAWWYSIFYVYTAATVLVAARLKPLLLVEVTETAVSHAWDTAIRLLGQYQAFTKLAKRCSTALSLLLKQVMQQPQQGESRGEFEVGPFISPASVSGISRPRTQLGGSPISIAPVHTQDWASTPADFVGPENQESSIEDVVRHFNTAGIHVDIFGDMSWLTGMPSQLY